MKSAFRLLAVAALASVVPACAGPSENAPDTTESAEQDLRSVARSFFTRVPLSGRRLESLRRSLEEEGSGHSWTRNQGTVRALQWQGSQHGALTPVERAALAQAAFAFHVTGSTRGTRRYLEQLTPVATDAASLSEALGGIGLMVMNPDADTESARARVLAALGAVARTRSITVMAARLEYQVDMYWERALVVIDEENEQILIATGGFGT